MVYSSDFYTSRRPAYYKPSTSYSVTPLFSSDGYDLPPSYFKAHQVYQTQTPIILTPPLSTGKPSPNVLPYNSYPYTHHQYVPLHRRSAATIHGVLDKIEHRPRSHPSYDPTDEYLNSKNATNFDDVTRDIRAQTAGLLKQVYTPSVRPKISSVSNGYSEVPIAKRIESDAYIEKILADSDSYRRENNIGKGHLACVSYAGGKAYPRRRPHLSKEVDDNITMLSYYNKTREAVAASATHPSVKINNREKYTINKKELPQSGQNTKKFVENESEADREAKKEKARLVAEREAAKLDAEEKASRLAAEEEKSRLAAEDEAAKLAAEKEAAEVEAARLAAEKKAAEEEAARLAAEKEAAKLEAERKAAEEEAARLAAEEEAAKLAAEKEAARLAAEEEAARLAAEKEAAEKEAAEKEAARLAAEKEAAEAEASRLAAEELAKKNTVEEELELENKDEEFEKTQRVTDEITTEEEIEESEQQLELAEKTTENTEIRGTNAAAIAESSTTTTSTEIINEDDGEVKTTAIFQRTVKTTTTVTSTSVISNNDDDDIKSTVEINEVIEEDGDSGAGQDAAQIDGQASSEEEDVSECEESEEE